MVTVVLPRFVIPETLRLVEVKFEILPVVTERLVEVSDVTTALVEVIFVKMPIDGVVLPIGVLFIVPPEMVRLSITMASVTELVGSARTPVTARLVEVSEVKTPFVKVPFVVLKLVVKKLVVVSEPPTEVVKVRPEEKRLVDEAEVNTAFVEVRPVKTPVLGVLAPIGVLLIVPPEMVSPSITIASVTELFGKFKLPVIARFVPVAFVNRIFVVVTFVEFR